MEALKPTGLSINGYCCAGNTSLAPTQKLQAVDLRARTRIKLSGWPMTSSMLYFVKQVVFFCSEFT